MVQYQSPVQQHHQITKLLYIKPTTTPSKAFIILHTSIPNCLRLTYGIHIPSHRHSGFSRQDRSGAEKLSNSGATKSFSVMLPRTPYCPRINGRDFRPLPWFPAAGTALDNRCLRVWSGTRKVHWLSMVGRVRQFVHTYPYLKEWDVSGFRETCLSSNTILFFSFACEGRYGKCIRYVRLRVLEDYTTVRVNERPVPTGDQICKYKVLATSNSAYSIHLV